jgi:hypothetical protein
MRCVTSFQESKVPRGGPEVQEMKSSEALRLEGYLKFHLAEILEELKSTNRGDPDSIKWGSAAIALKDCLLRSRDEITSALTRMQEGRGDSLQHRKLSTDRVTRARISVRCTTWSGESEVTTSIRADTHRLGCALIAST